MGGLLILFSGVYGEAGTAYLTGRPAGVLKKPYTRLAAILADTYNAAHENVWLGWVRAVG